MLCVTSVQSELTLSQCGHVERGVVLSKDEERGRKTHLCRRSKDFLLFATTAPVHPPSFLTSIADVAGASVLNDDWLVHLLTILHADNPMLKEPKLLGVRLLATRRTHTSAARV